jgi:fatty-acyl-CoA synthase
VAFILRHGESEVLVVDSEFSALATRAVDGLEHPPLLIDIHDGEWPDRASVGIIDYESLLAEGDPSFEGVWPADEWDPIALNYTSGTTGDPKGVVPSHRGAYLISLLQLTQWPVPRHPVYLWTLPMFHANGWCFTWAITAAAGNACLPAQGATRGIFDAIADHSVDHFCAAPTVMAMLTDAPSADRKSLSRPVKVLTAGSPPPAAMLETITTVGFDVDHVFGITEVSGTPVSCARQAAWDDLPVRQRSMLQSRQGVRAADFRGPHGR